MCLVHCTHTSLGIAYSLFVEPYQTDYENPPIRSSWQAFTLAYLFVDSIVMMKGYRFMVKAEFYITLFHHVLIGGALICVLFVGGMASWYAAAFQLLEIGNIAMHFHWFFETSKISKGIAFRLNGAALVLSYVLLRGVWCGYVWYHFSFGFYSRAVQHMGYALLIFLCSLFTLMQFYFTFLVIQGAYQAIVGIEQKEELTTRTGSQQGNNHRTFTQHIGDEIRALGLGSFSLPIYWLSHLAGLGALAYYSNNLLLNQTLPLRLYFVDVPIVFITVGYPLFASFRSLQMKGQYAANRLSFWFFALIVYMLEQKFATTLYTQHPIIRYSIYWFLSLANNFPGRIIFQLKKTTTSKKNL
mmetsp:Transcript_6715/g.10325  ORF Transcript_6715/g.10325 Transcript_6715/m.10325 type:complete len:356 (-) Transcript_6715:86-1153(-)